jgi:hypothetical protein
LHRVHVVHPQFAQVLYPSLSPSGCMKGPAQVSIRLAIATSCIPHCTFA